jgi:hypothetical protein
MRQYLKEIEAVLACAAFVLGLVAGILLLGRGAWLDEFWTLASTRPEQDWSEFWAVMAHEVHPPLHYLLIQLAQKLGLSDLASLRALNVLGLPLVFVSMWHANQRKALTLSQSCALTAIYAASPMFLDMLAELRAYFLLYSASISVTVLARTLMHVDDRGEQWDWRTLLLWGVSLAIFVNLHYFATLMGGLLTLAVILIRRRQNILPFLFVSAVAAGPALGFFVLQRLSAGPDITSWIATGRIDAVLVILDQTWAAGAGNIVAFGVAVSILLLAIESRESWRIVRDPLILAATLAVFFTFLTLANAVRPIVIDRYLIAGGGFLATALALLAAGPQAPRWSVVGICVFALLSQARVIYTGAYDRNGWADSAAGAAMLVSECPTTRVYTQPAGAAPPEGMFAKASRYGLGYYAERYGLETQELAAGDTVPLPGECPNLIWLEHILDPVPDLEALRAETMLEFTGRIDLVRVGSGVLIVNSAGSP